jgi:DNA-binding transcriptional LysR family regulator
MAEAGVGLAYLADVSVAGSVAAGRLECVLREFHPMSPGLYVYFPARAQTQPKLRAFIDMATALGRATAVGDRVKRE